MCMSIRRKVIYPLVRPIIIYWCMKLKTMKYLPKHLNMRINVLVTE